MSGARGAASGAQRTRGARRASDGTRTMRVRRDRAGASSPNGQRSGKGCGANLARRRAGPLTLRSPKGAVAGQRGGGPSHPKRPPEIQASLSGNISAPDVYRAPSQGHDPLAAGLSRGLTGRSRARDAPFHRSGGDRPASRGAPQVVRQYLAYRRQNWKAPSPPTSNNAPGPNGPTASCMLSPYWTAAGRQIGASDGEQAAATQRPWHGSRRNSMR